MTSILVSEGQVTVWLTLSAEYTNEETEPILATKQVRIPEDHPLVLGALNIWHFDKSTGRTWADNPLDNPAVAVFKRRLEAVLDQTFGATLDG